MRKYYKNHVKLNLPIANHGEPRTIIAQAILKKYKNCSFPVIIAVGGPGGTGKTTFAKQLSGELLVARILPLDNYKTPRALREQKNIFGAHPEANDIKLIINHLAALKQGKHIEKPVYCREQGAVCSYEKFSPERFIIIEGEIATYAVFHPYVDFSIFIDSDWKTQLNTRITRDIDQKGYTPKKAIATFLHSNLLEFAEYGAESKHWADLHIHCDEKYRLMIDAVCSKNADYFI